MARLSRASSGKSYIQLEYEYAVEKKKPFSALVVKEAHHEERVKHFGLAVDERAHRDKYDQFKGTVTLRLCAFWADLKDIQLAILQKLPEWAQRPDLAGWVRAEELPSAEATNEMARLSQENRELRSKLAAQAESFEGLGFEELARLLRETPLLPSDPRIAVEPLRSSDESVLRGVRESREASNIGQFFDCLQEGFWKEQVFLPVGARYPDAIRVLLLHGLISVRTTRRTVQGGSHQNVQLFKLTTSGRRFRNRLLVVGDGEERRRRLWTVEQSTAALESNSTSA